MRKKADTVLSISDRRLLNIDEAAAYVGQGRNSARQFFEEIGAIRRFGRRVLFDKKVIDAALDQMIIDQERKED